MPCVLFILLTTVWTRHLLPLHTSTDCVSSASSCWPACLTTLVTWELLSSMHPHVFHQPMVVLNLCDTARQSLASLRNSRQLVRDLSYLPGLSTLREVLTMKQSLHLLLHPLQSPLLHQDFVHCWLRLIPEQLQGLQLLSWLPRAGQPGPLSSSLLDKPTNPSSSVSEGWSLFHNDGSNSEHSNTDLSRSSSANTETRHKTIHSTMKVRFKL